MKLHLKKTAILAGLQKVNAVVGAKSTLPILSNVKLDAGAESIELTATDLDLTISAHVEAVTVARGGITTLPAKKLQSILSAIDAEDIELEVDGKDVASIKAGASRFKLVGMSAEEFPQTPKLDGNATLRISQANLRGALASVAFAASTEDSRAILNGALVLSSKGTLETVATDGRRMAHADTECDGSDAIRFVLPNKACAAFIATLGDGTATIHAGESQIMADLGDVRIHSRIVEGTYPNWKQVIPTSHKARAVVSREELLGVVHRVSMIGDKASPTTLAFSKNAVAVSNVSANVGEADETLAIKYDGADVTIAFNAEFLMAPLKALTCAEVAVELTDSLSPAVIRADGFEYVLMPMRTR
jgi:DNA polymerase III subunit beta